MSLVFLDTNILVYTLADGDPRQVIAEALLAQGFVLSVQVLNEFVNVARRKLKLSWPDIAMALSVFRKFASKPAPVTIATHEAGLELADRYGFRFYDSLIIASALELGCTTLMTEDMQDGQVIGGRLTLRNPFTRS